jgi:hypothetical protein
MTSDDTVENRYEELLKIASKANSFALVCHNSQCSSNYTNITTVWRRDESFHWLLHLSCNVCREKWSVCCQCPKFKVRMMSTKQISMHRNRYHSKVLEQQQKLNMSQNNRKRHRDEVDNDGK